ncbi:MAG: SDR family oxidoreductase [Anaerolineae bacterium]|nr:SDR family oxidoreductase [Anaerolineae bacterium]
MSGDMAGKVALVTGGSSGIGLATALAFARRGAQVAIASRDEARGQAALRKIEKIGAGAIWLQTDVSQPEQVEALVRGTVKIFGRLDYAFNNGGSGGPGGWLAEQADDAWNATLNGFLTSTFLCMKHELRQMLAQGGGAIVNNSSVDGLRAFPFDPAYSAAKHGVIGLTKSAAMQYAAQGVRINAVCPGWIRTPPVEHMITQNPDAEAQMLQHQPIGRLGEAEEVAEAVVWLCSEAASLIVGVSLAVDGGYIVV